MSREEALNKLDSGSYVIVPKWLSIIRNIVSPIAIITLIFISGGWKSEIDSKTFDSVQQKEQMIARFNSQVTVTEVDKSNIIHSISNNTLEIEDLKTKTDNFIPRNEVIILLESIAKDTKLNKELLLRIEKDR